MRLNRAAVGAIATILLIGLAGCGDDDPENGTEPTPTESSSSATETTEPSPTEPTPTEPVTDEDKASEALLGYLAVRDQAYETGRISKKLNRYATGRQHFTLQQFVTSLNNGKVETRFEGEWSHEIIRVKPLGADEIMVTDCQDGSDVEILLDGKVGPWITYDGEELPRRLEQTYRVILEGDLWKVEVATSLPTKVKPC